MSDDDALALLDTRLVELRTSFDHSFASAPSVQTESPINLVVVRSQGDFMGFRLSELVALQPAGRVVPVPDKRFGLLGIAGIRGRIVPVFDLAQLLGSPGAPVTPRWMLLCASARGESLALAVEQFEGLWAVAPTSISSRTDEHGRYFGGVAHRDDRRCSIVDLPPLLAALQGDGDELIANKSIGIWT